MRKFGRFFIPDERDNKYCIWPSAKTSKRKRRMWSDNGVTLDQGETPHCVGYAFAHCLLADPIQQYVDPNGVYEFAQYVDEWEGTDYEGTSVRAGAKVLASLGFISEYRWGSSLDDLVETLLESGPVVVGTNWYGGMMEPDADGFVRVSGDCCGGHAWLINGVDRTKQRLRLHNSWGAEWGKRGDAWISYDDMARLIDEDGEICLLVERKPTASC